MTIDTTLVSVADVYALSMAEEQLRAGHLVIVPTETIFGLTADATNRDSVTALFTLKQRPLSQPAAIYLPDRESIGRYAIVEQEYAQRLINEYLPGPLTVVLKSKSTEWPGVVSSGGKIGIRVSSEPFVRDLLRRLGKPLIATSANISGKPDCYSLVELKRSFSAKVPLIVYRQENVSSAGSTVIDASGSRPQILRQGAIDLQERLAAILRENQD